MNRRTEGIKKEPAALVYSSVLGYNKGRKSNRLKRLAFEFGFFRLLSGTTALFADGAVFFYDYRNLFQFKIDFYFYHNATSFQLGFFFPPFK